MKTLLRRSRTEGGSTYVEFMVALPILFLLIIGIIDLAWVLTISGVLHTSSSRAASLASVVPGLDSESTTKNSANRTPREEALYRVRTLAKELPLKTFLTDASVASRAKLVNVNVSQENINDPVRIILPIESHLSLQQSLNDKPIEVTVHAQVSTFLPILNPIDLTGRTLAYREPRFTSAIPVALDCAGDPIAGNSSPNEEDCPCLDDPDPAKRFDPSNNACVCRGNLELVNDECVCPERLSDPDEDFKCTCPLECGEATEYLNSASCECKPCPDGKFANEENTGCECPPFSCEEDQFISGCGCGDCPWGQIRYPQIPSKCYCPTHIWQGLNCPSDQHANVAQCICTPCPKNHGQDPKAPWACKCIANHASAGCTNTQWFNPGNCNCFNCPSGQVVNPANTKTCKCPEGVDASSCSNTQYFHSSKCECRDCPINFVQNPNNPNHCICPPSAKENANCANNEYFNTSSCGCSSCPHSQVAHPSNLYCHCPYNAQSKGCGDGEAFNSYRCECVPCPEGQIRNPLNQAQCICPSPQVKCGGQCHTPNCAADETFNYSTCSCIQCPAPFQVINGQCTCPISASDCQSGEAFNSQQCSCDECPSPKIPNSNATSCVCPSCPGNQQLSNSTTCACVCPSGTVQIGNNPVCAPEVCKQAQCVYDGTQWVILE